MNQAETKAFVEANGIATLQADMTHTNPEASELLSQLGNKSGSIPFAAIFPASNPNKPILVDGILTSPAQIIAKFKLAIDASDVPPSEVPETAMATPAP